MTDVPTQERLTSFHSLPAEVRHHIFKYIYPPWHFEYTQVHDTLPTYGSKDINSAAADIAVELTSTPRFSDLPSIAPLLVCKDFHNAGRHIFDSSFTGHIHVISGMIWKEVHWTYACIMAKATTLTINISHVKSLVQCMVLNRLQNLKTVIVVSTAFSSRSSSFQMLGRRDDGKDEVFQDSEQLPLEGSGLTSFLPTHVDLSDTSLQNFPRAHRLYMDDAICSMLTSMDMKVTHREVIGVPVRPEHADQGVAIFLILDFLEERWDSLQKGSSEDMDLYILVRKRLAMLKQEAS